MFPIWQIPIKQLQVTLRFPPLILANSIEHKAHIEVSNLVPAELLETVSNYHKKEVITQITKDPTRSEGNMLFLQEQNIQPFQRLRINANFPAGFIQRPYVKVPTQETLDKKADDNPSNDNQQQNQPADSKP